MTCCIKSIVPLDFLFVVCWRGLVKLIKSIVPLDFLFVVCRRGLVIFNMSRSLLYYYYFTTTTRIGVDCLEIYKVNRLGKIYIVLTN